MLSHPFLSLQAAEAGPGESESGDEEDEEIDEFLDDEMTVDDAPVSSRAHRLLSDDDSDDEEDLEQIAADIRARHARSRVERQTSPDALQQLDAVMYCFAVPDFKAKVFESQLNALKLQTSAAPLLEHVITVPHLPRHIFVLASPTTISEVVRRLSLPYPRVIPRHEWGNSLESVPWTQRREYPSGSFVKILEKGPYHGDLAYVMAADFQTNNSAIDKADASVIVAVLPRIEVKPPRKQQGRSAGPPIADEARIVAIQAQIQSALDAQSASLDEIVQVMREKERIVLLRKRLMKEKDDLVLNHGRSTKSIDQQVADVASHNAKEIKDLEREYRHATDLRKSTIQQDIVRLQNHTRSFQEGAAENVAVAKASYQSQLELIRSRIEEIPPLPQLPGHQHRPRPALFDFETVEAILPGSCHYFQYTGEDIFEFLGSFPDALRRATIVTNPISHQPEVGFKDLTYWSLDTPLIPQAHERIFFCKGRIFFRGLELVPIHDNRSLEVAAPTAQELEPFVQSQFDGPRINRLFSALHWNHGDKLLYGADSQPGLWYYLRELRLMDLSVRARKIDARFVDRDPNDATSGLEDVELHLQWTQRAFAVGDSVEVIIGPHRGESGIVGDVNSETISVMAADHTEFRVARDFIRTCLTVSTSVKLRVGDTVVVIGGEHQGQSGTIVGQGGSFTLIKTVRDRVEISVSTRDIQKDAIMFGTDFSPHITLSSMVRVLRGPYKSRQGVVSEKLNQGRELKIIDPDNNENFVVSPEEVQHLLMFQDPSRASRALPRPWMNVNEPPAVGDFIQVVGGQHQGREGCIAALGPDLQDDYSLSPTDANATMPTLVLEDETIDEPRISDTVLSVLPAEVAFLRRIQLFDTVRVLHGPFSDTTGYVRQKYDGTGWFMVQTLRQRLRLYRSNIELLDRLCVNDPVRVIAVGNFYGKQGTVNEVDADGQALITTVPANRVIRVSAVDVEREPEGVFSYAPRDPALHKRVQVVKGPMKSSAGYVVDKNHILGFFVVGLEFSGVKMNFKGSELVYFDTRKSLDETPSSATEASASLPESSTSASASLPELSTQPLREPLLERGQTPIPDSNIPGWGFDDDDHMDLDSSSFLTRGIWSAASGKHIRVITGADKRYGYTTTPIQFDNPLRPSTVLLYFTDAHGRWKKGHRPLRDLSPSPPNKKNQSAMILTGSHEGSIYQTVRVARKQQTALFESDGLKWDEKLEDLCVVDDHNSSGCDCEKAP